MKKIENQHSIKINMGCGSRDFGSDWVNIDGGNYPHIQFNDITKLCFKNNTVDLIYSSHVIEYFDRLEIISILKEWKRVLKLGGILRLAVPDFLQMIRGYMFHAYPLDAFLGPLYGKMNMAGEWIYHKTVYDFESLNKLLTTIGFKNVHTYDWRKTEHGQFDDCSQAYLPHMEKETGLLISLNVECYK